MKMMMQKFFDIPTLLLNAMFEEEKAE